MASVHSAGERIGARWVSLERAALHLGMTAAALRKSLERRAVRAADGATEATLDGVRARKFGRSWRVRFSEAWGSPASLRGALHEARKGA
jgi:hypothetical protein